MPLLLTFSKEVSIAIVYFFPSPVGISPFNDEGELLVNLTKTFFDLLVFIFYLQY